MAGMDVSGVAAKGAAGPEVCSSSATSSRLLLACPSACRAWPMPRSATLDT
jgi:hypothetical protein